jgi:hypothetical protein
MAVFSYIAGVAVCIDIVFMSVSCFLQKPWRFEVCVILLLKVIGK